MQKKYTRKTSVVALLITLTLMISGCNNASSSTPISSVHKSFKNDFDTNLLKTVISKVAKQKQWDIMSTTSLSLQLKKTYTKKRRVLSPPTKRSRRIEVKSDLYVNVDINKKDFKIELSQESKQALSSNDKIKEFNKDLKELEEAIYIELAHEVL